MNNILHLRYAVEVERTGSISKAAENLYMAQPHLSKAIRELEESLNISVFNRTSKGVFPTKKGAEFLTHAKYIIAQVDEIEAMFKPTDKELHRFDICVPRASYISLAFSEYVKLLNDDKKINLNYRETNSADTIANVTDNINNLGIIRYQTSYERNFLNLLDERELKHLPVCEYECSVLMSTDHPLASKNNFEYKDLQNYIEIIHGDISVPALSISEAKQLAALDEHKKRISLYERCSELELLNSIHTSYMWVSPMPPSVLKRYSLVAKTCIRPKNKYKDILIYRNGYRLNNEDNLFIEELRKIVSLLVPKYNNVEQKVVSTLDLNAYSKHLSGSKLE